MPSFSTPVMKKSKSSGVLRRFSLGQLFSGHSNSSKSGSSSSLSKIPSPPSLSDSCQSVANGHSPLRRKSTPGRLSRELNGDEAVDDEDEELRHLDMLGLVLENTFKDVESIDSYVSKLHSEFQQELVSEQRFMSCVCSARIARAACCKKQVEAWHHLQHGLIEFCCHHHQDALHASSNSSPKDGAQIHQPQQRERRHSVDSTSSTVSQDAEVDALVSQLHKMSTFHSLTRRLEPQGDPKSFMLHWILNHEDYSQCHEADSSGQSL